MGWEGYKNGWATGERAVLFMAWVTPLLSMLPVATNINVQLTPIPLIVFLIYILRHDYSKNLTKKQVLS